MVIRPTLIGMVALMKFVFLLLGAPPPGSLAPTPTNHHQTHFICWEVQSQVLLLQPLSLPRAPISPGTLQRSLATSPATAEQLSPNADLNTARHRGHSTKPLPQAALPEATP
jgi:hypothetical protein